MTVSRWQDATVLLTGGTGSFGQAFVDYALRELPVRTIRVYSRDELKQALMAARLGATADQHRTMQQRVRFLLGDVRDEARLERAMQGVDIVIHAAALKRVDAIAYDPQETAKTNIGGVVNLIDAALATGVQWVLGISSDKAAQACNLYGGTKFVGEQLLTYANHYAGAATGPRFAAARYGNVLGSRGSVLHVWRDQISRGLAPQITDPAMTRFWLPLSQVCRYVAASIEAMQGGEVFIPNALASSVYDLLRAAFGEQACPPPCGLRPGGEKRHETLISEDESARAYTSHSGGYSLEPDVHDWDAARVPRGDKLPPGFVLRSNTATQATLDALRALLVEADWSA